MDNFPGKIIILADKIFEVQVGPVSIMIMFSYIFYLECGYTLEKTNKQTKSTGCTHVEWLIYIISPNVPVLVSTFRKMCTRCRFYHYL